MGLGIFGDGSTNTVTCITASSARSNILTGGQTSFYNYNGDNVWSAGQVNSAGVNTNMTYDASVASYGTSSGAGSGFTDGTHTHPNALYNDLDGVNPAFFDTTRRPTGYDAICGGAGTLTSL